MIRFPCICGEMYEMPEDRAGTSFQCSRCGKLVDVPALNDLEHMGADGTYGLDEKPIEMHESAALEEMIIAFSRDKIDAFGNEKDLRNTQDDYASLGGPETLEFADDSEQPGVRRVAPKYDPITGELIRPMDVKSAAPASDPSAPVAKAMIAYARHRYGEGPFPASRIIPEMFRAPNLVVLMVIFVIHVLLQFMTFVGMMMFLLVPVLMIMAGLMLSHYAVVVNDIATEDKDELPRPLRDFSWHDDLWGPFVHFVLAFGIAYGPIAAINWLPHNGVLMITYLISAAIFGTVIFPALFLTTTTSGHWLNLAPDRVLRVMTNLGVKYVLCVILWGVAFVTYVIGIGGTFVVIASLYSGSSTWPLVTISIAYPLLLVGIFMMHVFCWYLGLQYRTYQPTFGWALQSHYGRKPEPRPKQGFYVGPTEETPAARRARMQGQRPVPAVPVQPASPPQQPPR